MFEPKNVMISASGRSPETRKGGGGRGTGNPIVTDTYMKLQIFNLYENMYRA